MANKIKWEEADFKWDAAPAVGTPFTWDEVVLIEEIAEEVAVNGAAGLGTEAALEKLPEDKKKKVIKLVMRRRGIKMYDETKEVKNITAHVEQVEMIIKEVKATMLVENINV